MGGGGVGELFHLITHNKPLRLIPCDHTVIFISHVTFYFSFLRFMSKSQTFEITLDFNK